MKRIATGVIALVFILLSTTSLRAQVTGGLKDLVEQARKSARVDRGGSDKTEEEPLDPSQIKRPQDFAPLEHIVAGRDPADFRPKGTLLADTTTNIPTVNEEALLQRRYALYEGRRLSHHPVYSDEYLAFAEAGLAAIRSDADATDQTKRWTGFWWWVLLALSLATIVLWRKGYLTAEDVAV